MLHIAIALGLVAGLGLGLLAAATGSDFLMAIATGVAPIGTAFMNAIRMVVIPLVMAVIFSGVAKLGDPRKLGRLGGLTLAFYWTTMVPAILLGMGVMWVGLAFTPEVTAPAVAAQAAPELPSMVDFLVSLIPANPFAAATNGALLPLIVFTALLAAATGTLDEGPRERLVGLADATGDALIKLSLVPADTIAAAAEQFFALEGVRRGQAWRTTVNGLPVASGTFSVGEPADGSAVAGLVVFVGLDQQVLRLVGYAPADIWPGRQVAVETSLASFQRLTATADLKVQPRRLVLTRVQQPITLAAFHRAYPSSVSLEEIARLNRLRGESRLSAGTLVKRVVGGPE